MLLTAGARCAATAGAARVGSDCPTTADGTSATPLNARDSTLMRACSCSAPVRSLLRRRGKPRLTRGMAVAFAFTRVSQRRSFADCACSFPPNREAPDGDSFAQDCVHHHLFCPQLAVSVSPRDVGPFRSLALDPALKLELCWADASNSLSCLTPLSPAAHPCFPAGGTGVVRDAFAQSRDPFRHARTAGCLD